MRISVFTVCMPEYNPAEAVAALSKWGYDGVEWRVTTPPKAGEPVVNFWQGNRATISPETIAAEAGEIKKLCRKNKIETPYLATYLGYKDLKLVENCMEAAAIMGAKGIRVGVEGYNGSTSYDKLVSRCVKGWEKVVKLGKKYKVKPMAELHMGNIVCSASAARRFAENFSPAEIGLIYDPGNMVLEGRECWKMGLEILGKYLEHVHVKNMSWFIKEADSDRNLRWDCKSDGLRRGQVNWAEVIKALKEVGYDGWLSLEDFSEGSTEAKLKDDIKYLRSLINKA